MNGIRTFNKKEGNLLNTPNPRLTPYPKDITPFEHQVAGHSSENGKSPLGLLKNNDGYVLKPIIKAEQGNREKKFYSDLQAATDTVSTELRNFVPEYLGSTVLNIDKKDVEFLVLKNITQGFSEPCVMDIKIGKQTWDPEATPEKRQHEDRKYMQSKQELGFCIPGFQVHNISTGTLVRMEKDYGKTLTKHTTMDALKLFLNADSGLSRHLLLQLLAQLWRILRWCRLQRKYCFYSSSLLLVYDAKCLRQCMQQESSCNLLTKLPSLCSNSTGSDSMDNLGNTNNLRVGPLSPTPVNGELHLGLRNEAPSRSGSSSPNRCPTQSINLERRNCTLDAKSWHNTRNRDCISHTHSLVNNCEIDVEGMKNDYLFQLNNLMQSDEICTQQTWSIVKMIDFAHAFPGIYDAEDSNYVGGIENLVKLLEEILDDANC